MLQIKRIDALLSQFRLKLTSKRAEYQPVDLPSLWLRVCELLDNEIRAGKFVSPAIFRRIYPRFLRRRCG